MIKMVVTDLDGTLLNSEKGLSNLDQTALLRLRAEGIVLVLATGRSLYGAQKSIEVGKWFDFVIFSSGLGIWETRTQKVMRAGSLNPKESLLIQQKLLSLNLCFTRHLPIPENHKFLYRLGSKDSVDFSARISRNPLLAAELDLFEAVPEVSQFLAVVPSTDIGVFDILTSELPHQSVIRATSPVDHKSLWLEIFPHGTCKSLGAKYLANMLAITAQQVAALGNDYNDLDLLQWAGQGSMVSNAPEELKKGFDVVPSNDESGFSEFAARLD